MISRKSIDLAVHGVIAKASAIARSHGQYAYGHEAKILAEFIATEIDQLDNLLHAWEEHEAGKVAKAHQQADDPYREMVANANANEVALQALFNRKANDLKRRRARSRAHDKAQAELERAEDKP